MVMFPPLFPLFAYVCAFGVLGAIAFEDWLKHRIRNSYVLLLGLFTAPVYIANVGSAEYLVLSGIITLFWALMGYYKRIPMGDTKLFVVVAWLWPSAVWQVTFWAGMMFQALLLKKDHPLAPDVLKAGIATVLIGSVLAASLSGLIPAL